MAQRTAEKRASCDRRCAPGRGRGGLALMSLGYATEHLTAAVRSLAASEDPLPERLQIAWDQHVQMVWMKPCLTRDLLREFRDLWQRYTAPSDDRRSTKLRALTREESVGAVDDLVLLTTKVAIADAHAVRRRTTRNARRPAVADPRAALPAGPVRPHSGIMRCLLVVEGGVWPEVNEHPRRYETTAACDSNSTIKAICSRDRRYRRRLRNAFVE